jgi:hypothetical protein
LERFSFSFSVYEVPSQGRIVYHRKAQAGEKKCWGLRPTGLLPCWFLNAAALACFPFFHFSLYNEFSGVAKEKKSLWAVLANFTWPELKDGLRRIPPYLTTLDRYIIE